MAGSLLSSLRNRPRLLSAIGVGVATGLALLVVPNDLRPSTRAILAWDVGCVVLIVLDLTLMARETTAEIRQRADRQDEGRGMILLLAMVAAAASLAAVAIELSLAKGETGWGQAWRVGLSVGTVGLSWFVAQLMYALHYAHEYYTADDEEPGDTRQGLAFPGGEAPDYWDFLHFSVVIGVAAQTADVAFTSKAMRRVGTVHSLFAFAFNTVVLALTVNLAAGLF